MLFNPAKNSDQRDWRLAVSLLSAAALALFFWLSSRYPALNEKAAMGGDAPVSGISFDIILEILPDSGTWWELTANVVNWISTNLKGMTFGVLFGAAALTLLSLIKKRSFENAFANSALGVVIGAPLGVCVNCAAPIALGLHMGRMRLETTLSALLASPTLNVIVVTMSFALLPVHLAVIKLLLALVMVLLIVPLLCKFLLKTETEATRHNVGRVTKIAEPKGLTAWIARMLAPADAKPEPLGPFASLLWFVKTYARNFFFIFIITVPMMFLAALLGAVVATFVTPNELFQYFPRGSIILVIIAMLVTAGVTSFVPAPIALDVILTVILINIGMPVHFGMVALIGLGSFSIYAFIILWRAISLRTGLAIWGAVIILAVIGGVMAKISQPMVEKYYQSQQLAALNSVDGIEWPKPPAPPPGKTLAELRPLLDAQTPAMQAINAEGSSDGGSAIKLQRRAAFEQGGSAASSGKGGPIFSRVTGTKIGLMEEGVNSPIREFGYYMMRGGIAAGDVHGDGWTDIVTRRPDHANGLSLYANIKGKFIRQSLDLGPVDDLEIFNVALADIDGDGRLDLFVSTISGGDYLFYNQGGDYSAANMVQLVKPEHAVTNSVAFADMDGDGDVDVILGRWAPRGISEGWKLRPKHIANQIHWNEGNRAFRTEIIPGIPGQTLTNLVADFDHDGHPDFFNGDDAGFTDGVTFFGAGGKIRKTSLDDQPFPYHTRSSMSYDEGDWNNDLRSDYYGAQIAVGTAGQASHDPPNSNRTIYNICAQFGRDIAWSKEQVRTCARDLLSMNAVRNSRSGKSMDSCMRPEFARDRALCGAASLFPDFENKFRDPKGDQARFERCKQLLVHIPLVQVHCRSILEPTIGDVSNDEIFKHYRNGFGNGNILMTGTKDGKFIDSGKEAAVRSPGWSWNSRFTDLDQDGWQDILVMTGIWINTASSTTNVLYHNNHHGFDDATKAFGLYDPMPSYSFVTLDYDRDGDVDIIRDNGALRMMVHRNDHPAGKALYVNLRDRKGNSMAIGARVIICVDGETTARPGKCQMRNIKASGGYMSSDPINAHFGLGKAKSVSLIEIRWPDGEVSRLLPKDLDGGELVIERS